MALVRLALALGRRVGLTASAIDPTASSASPLVFIKFLLFPTTYPVPPPDCHMIKSPPLPEKGRQLGASTVCIRGQTTPESFSPEGSGPTSFRPGPAPEPGCTGPPGFGRGRRVREPARITRLTGGVTFNCGTHAHLNHMGLKESAEKWLSILFS